MTKIKTLIIYLINKCNLKCKHCFYYKDLEEAPLQQISLEQLDKIIGQVKPWGVTVTGGEPFLRDDIFEVCKILDKHGVRRIGLLSNGLLTDKIVPVVEKILQNVKAVVNFNMSIDGLEELHDDIRGVKGSFNAVVETTRRLRPFLNKYKNFQMCLRAVVMKSNYKELEQIYEFVDNKLKIPLFLELVRGGASAGVCGNFSNEFYHPKDTSLFLDKNDIKELRKIFARIFSKRGKNPLEFVRQASQYNMFAYLLDTLENEKALVRCTAGTETGVVYPNGDVGICEFMNPAGNLYDTGFDFNKIWFGEKANQQRKIIPECYCTHGCFVSGEVLNKKVRSYPNRVKSSLKLIRDRYLDQ